jgi:hypothetical protein
MVNQEVQELIFRSDTSGLVKADTALASHEKQLKAVHAATASYTSNANMANRATIELARGFQDFSAAGMYGIANNVEGITLALKGLFSDGMAAGLKTFAGAMMGRLASSRALPP